MAYFQLKMSNNIFHTHPNTRRKTPVTSTPKEREREAKEEEEEER
jgi:hypothetical protein